jgi:broad specificity phosphatase PhoE
LRHGEGPRDPAAPDDPADPNLSPAGVERAKMLVTLIPSKFGNLYFLVAAENSNKSHRPVETLQPLANKLEFPADKFIQTYANDSYPVLASDLLVKRKYLGTLIIVC